jgi:hypothetical protein
MQRALSLSYSTVRKRKRRMKDNNPAVTSA